MADQPVKQPVLTPQLSHIDAEGAFWCLYEMLSAKSNVNLSMTTLDVKNNCFCPHTVIRVN